MADFKLCSIPNCGKPVKARGWCGNHHHRWSVHGDPLAGRTPNGEAERYYREVVLTYDGDECLLWPYARTEGYGVMYQNGRMGRVSRLACEEVNGPPPTPQHHAAHSCGNGHLGCVTKRHLLWKTAAENAADKLEHDTHNRGERNPLSKLTERQVREIRSLDGRMTQRAIAKRFAINYRLVSRIIRRERWAWLD